MIGLTMPKKPKPPTRLTLEEPGTIHRQAQAARLGDSPEDAASTDTPGLAVRKYTITDMLSYLYRRGIVDERGHDGALRWKEDWTTAGKEPRVVVRQIEDSRGTVESWATARLEARRRFTQAGQYLGQREYQACFGVIILDEATNGRIVDLRAGMRALADWYGLPMDEPPEAHRVRQPNEKGR